MTNLESNSRRKIVVEKAEGISGEAINGNTRKPLGGEKRKHCAIRLGRSYQGGDRRKLDRGNDNS